MDFFKDFNFISAAILLCLAVPIIGGLLAPFSSERMKRTFGALLNNVAFIGCLVLSIYLTGALLADTYSPFLQRLYKLIPPLENFITGKDIWVYIVVTLFFLIVTYIIAFLLTRPVYQHVVVPLANKIAKASVSMPPVIRHVLGAVWQIPKAIIYTLAFTLLLNFVAGFSWAGSMAQSINQSGAYRRVNESILQPLLETPLAQKIPVVLMDSFENAAATLEERNIRLVRYFNGVTLEDAIASNDEIDALALSLTDGADTDREKAKRLYDWVSRNIAYDQDKARAVSVDPTGIDSGAIVAYETRTGICFDFATLYVAMCRAAAVDVRFVTGMGYSGTEWGDHAWNEIYDPADDRWINVDTTFGASGLDYFDRPGFESDHRDAVVQGAWS